MLLWASLTYSSFFLMIMSLKDYNFTSDVLFSYTFCTEIMFWQSLAAFFDFMCSFFLTLVSSIPPLRQLNFLSFHWMWQIIHSELPCFEWAVCLVSFHWSRFLRLFVCGSVRSQTLFSGGAVERLMCRRVLAITLKGAQAVAVDFFVPFSSLQPVFSSARQDHPTGCS